MVTIKSFAFNPFQVNSFVVYDETLQCLIIDAACYEDDEFEELYSFISAHSLKPMAVLNTHGHVDHILGTKRVCEKYSIGFFMNKDDKFLLEQAAVYGKAFGFQVETPPEPKGWLEDGETYSYGNSGIGIRCAPGHSPGSVVFYSPEGKFIITGDVLFEGSIGRTDLPGGNYNQLIESIRTKILVLPGDTKVFPGHGSTTSIGFEMLHNPFLNRSS